MGKILLRPMRSDVQYQGQYSELAFDTLVTPVPLYRSLLKYLGPYGVTLRELAYESPTLSETRVSCIHLNLSTNLFIRLDRLEVSFLRFQEIGGDIAQRFLLDSWAAVHEVTPSLDILEHRVMGNIDVRIQDVSYGSIIQRYVRIPAALGEQTHAGVAFYLPSDLSRGERGGHIVLDRLAAQEDVMVFRMTILFDARQVPLDTLDSRVAEYITRHLDSLGLAFDQENSR